MRVKINNVWSNILLLISYACFLVLNYQLRKGYILGILLAIGLAIVFTAFHGKMANVHKEEKKRNQILALLGTIGILFTDARLFYEMMIGYDKAEKLVKYLHVPKTAFLLSTAIVLSIVSFIAVYILLLYFYRFFLDDVLQILLDLNKKERKALIVLMFIGACFVVAVYAVTGVFYGSSSEYDAIYTADSGIIFKQNCFLWLASGQNDLRQPLFSVFSAPFVGIFSAFTIPFSFSEIAVACVTQIVNVMALFLTIVMVSELLLLKENTKIIFWILLMTCYPVLLFHIMVEQYIFVVFWLVFFIRLALRKSEKKDIAFIGAVGGLITNAAMLPLLFFEDNANWKARINYVWKTFLKGVFAILVFSRLDVILHSMDQVKGAMSFTGQGLTLTEKWYQYTTFIRSCLIAPQITLLDDGEVTTWQLAEANHTDWIGVVILVFVCVSFLINRKDIICQVSFGWTTFSALLLLFVGYGASENGMILYSLYFGWTMWILLFKLLQKVLEKYKVNEKVLQSITVAIAIVLFTVNIKGILEMISFARQFYPY